jgi:hypothetical protein
VNLKNKCSKCSDEYGLGQETAVLHVFTQAPGYSYLAATCPIPACGKEELVFFVPGGIKLSEVQEVGFDVVVHGTPDQWVVDVYNTVTESTPARVYGGNVELTESVRDRHERIARHFAFDLDDATPDDIINAPRGKHPVRWD